MSLILAPYNNAMRLGQGFNSFTQQICIDDAVIINPDRAENVLTNDGNTMRIMVQSLGKPSAWSRQKEIVFDSRVGGLKMFNFDGDDTSGTSEAGNHISKAIDKVSKKMKPRKTENTPGSSIAEEESPATAEEAQSETAVGASNHGEDVEPEEDGEVDEASGKEQVVEIEKDKVEEEELNAEDEPEKKPSKPKNTLAEKITSSQSKQLDDQEKKELMRAEREREIEEKKLRREREKEHREAEKEKKEEQKRRHEETKKLVEWGASTVGYTKEELEAMKHNIKFEERFNGILENRQDPEFDPNAPRGPSQVVTYTSRFIDKLSDITDDMNISGSLSIKAGKFGGSGRGAFIDSDKFKESDLNFYISVKVVNQTINFKDALEYNPVSSVNGENFREVFGDSFISGFQEGGEFNAVVSMKILNKAKKTDIKAEAKVAFTAGPLDIKAEANVNIAKENIETNTETTIQVSWSGGGHIKPMEQQWDIKSLMQAASRFPDLVAECPQRTYAILTKYDTLRSFVKLKPAAYTKLQYENAQIYTNEMMDTYMSYKSLYTKIGADIFSLKNKTKVFKLFPEEQNTLEKSQELSDVGSNVVLKANPEVADDDCEPFPATIKGLEAAKKAIRHQLALIVNEVDLIEKNPKIATNDDHTEPYQSVATFEERIPKVEAPNPPAKIHSLGGKRIMAKTQTEEEFEEEEREQVAGAACPPLFSGIGELTMDEQSSLDLLQQRNPEIGRNLRVTGCLGSGTSATAFNNLDFLQPEWSISVIRVDIAEGAIAAFQVHYENGLIISRGKPSNDRGRVVELSNFQPGERIVAASISVGKGPTEPADFRVLALVLYTNRGRQLRGQAERCTYEGSTKSTRDGIAYTEVTIQHFDIPLQTGDVKGFLGCSDDRGITRLGLIWGDLSKTQENSDGNNNDTLVHLSTSFEETITALNAQLASVRNEKAETELKWGARPDGFRSGRMEIHFIEWGGQLVWDQNIANRLIGYAERGEAFCFDCNAFGCDPRPGLPKNGAIIYRYDGRGELRCLARNEGEVAQFDGFP